jgi:predicted ABC-type exoprotein transport system permease subunit
MVNHKNIIYNFSSNTKNVSFLTIVALLLLIIVFFIPLLNSLLIFIGKIAALFLLGFALFLNLKNTNYATKNLKNLFVDPSMSNIRNNMLLNYLLSFSLLALIVVIITSFA